MTILAGDVGGTKTLLALFDADGSGGDPVREERYDSGDYPGLGKILREFLGDGGDRPEAACFGVPGAVVDGVCRTPNLPWVIRERDLREDTGIDAVELVNDFVAAAKGVPDLPADRLRTLQEGMPETRAPKAIIGAGTGLGQAVLVPAHDRWRVLPTEAGHGDFAARGVVQRALLAHLEQRLDHVSVERVVSGPGIVTIFEFLADGLNPVSADTRRRVETADDKAAAITRLATEESDPTCTQALAVFVEAYGAEAGNLALRSLPKGGLYVGGGIAPKIADTLAEGAFMRAFLDKGRLRDLLSDIPVHVVLEERLGLLGAAARARELAS